MKKLILMIAVAASLLSSCSDDSKRMDNQLMIGNLVTKNMSIKTHIEDLKVEQSGEDLSFAEGKISEKEHIDKLEKRTNELSKLQLKYDMEEERIEGLKKSLGI